ncbi:hypothetical protein ACWEH1_30020, partial [Micromonospora chersina]
RADRHGAARQWAAPIFARRASPTRFCPDAAQAAASVRPRPAVDVVAVVSPSWGYGVLAW